MRYSLSVPDGRTLLGLICGAFSLIGTNQPLPVLYTVHYSFFFWFLKLFRSALFRRDPHSSPAGRTAPPGRFIRVIVSNS